jgi:hypothetical protein
VRERRQFRRLADEDREGGATAVAVAAAMLAEEERRDCGNGEKEKFSLKISHKMLFNSIFILFLYINFPSIIM